MPEQKRGQPVFEVFNPRGFLRDIHKVPLSPRAGDLRDRTVYVINSGIYRAYVFTKRVAQSLPHYLPGVKVVFRAKPSGWMTSDPELWDEAAENGSAFIYGPAGGTSGHVWGARWSILLERKGLPGVYVLSEGYEQAVQLACEGEGMPQLRRVVTPMPSWGSESLDTQMDRIMKQIVEGLTVPLTDSETTAEVIPREKPSRVATGGTLGEVQRYFYEHKWTDGLPIIPPTEEAVANMLKGTRTCRTK